MNPDEARLARFLDQFFGVKQGGKMPGDSVEYGRAFVARPLLLRVLDLFPVRPDLIDILHFHIAEDMRMAPNEFVRDMTGDFFEVERTAFLRELAVENDLQQEIAQLLRHFVIVFGFNGIKQLIDFLHRVKAQRHVILLAVPGTAIRRTQPRHHGEQVIDGAFGLRDFLHNGERRR